MCLLLALTESACDPNAAVDGTSALLEALRLQATDVVRALISAQASVNLAVHQSAPLHLAQTAELVALLSAERADANARD